MIIKTYTSDYINANGYPDDKEFIIRDDKERLYQWFKTIKPRFVGASSAVCHRLDGPAIAWDDGSEEWIVNDNLHRVDGPAEVMRSVAGNRNSWWIKGQKVNSYHEFQKVTGCSDEDIILLKLKWGEIA